MPERVSITVRAQKILEIARAHTGEDLTIMELAELCDATPGKGFGLALAHARHLALDNDEDITPCVWNPRRRAATLRHILPGEEDGAMLKPLSARQNDVATRLKNIGRHADWTGRHAEHPDDRKFGKEIANYARSSERVMRFLAELALKAQKNR